MKKFKREDNLVEIGNRKYLKLNDIIFNDDNQAICQCCFKPIGYIDAYCERCYRIGDQSEAAVDELSGATVTSFYSKRTWFFGGSQGPDEDAILSKHGVTV